VKVRAALLAIVLGVTGPACAGGGLTKQATLVEIAEHTSRAARHFSQARLVGGQRVAIDGLAEDDYRYQATVSVNGAPAYAEVVADDARYVRVFDPALVAPDGRVDDLAAVDPAYAAALSGAWVVDPKGAPAEFRGTTKALAAPLNPDLVLSALRYLDGIRDLMPLGTTEYNVDAVNYLPKNDKFRAIRAPKAKRFDAAPAGFDPSRAAAITLASLQRFFRWSAIWTDKRGHLVRIESRTELPDPSDHEFSELYRQIGRAGSNSLQSMLALGAPGRLLTESFTVDVDPTARIEIPTGATEVSFGAAFAKAAPVFGPLLQRAGPLTGLPT